MASSWEDALSEQADQMASRLRQFMSSALSYLHREYGIDSGINPDLYPSWVIVCTALIGPLIAVVLLWVAACSRRKRPVAKSETTDHINVSVNDAAKTPPIKVTKAEEPKKKNRKKATDKQKTQSNGGTVPEPQQEVKVVKELPKQQPPPPAPAAAPPPPPVDPKAEKLKKNKKKPKPEVKQTQGVSFTEGKELDEDGFKNQGPACRTFTMNTSATQPEGAWETKISNREKRQQRKKEKGPGDESGSPGGGRISQQVELPSVPASVSTKKNKNNKESVAPKAPKGDSITTPAPASWNAVNSVNAGGWTEVSTKPKSHVNVLNNEKWSGSLKSEPLAWAKESEGSWPSRIKTEPKTVNLTVHGLKPSAADSVASSKVESLPADEWSSINGLGAENTGSDWNAPTEWWGNYEEPKVETAAAQERPVSQPVGESEDDKEKGDPSESGKAKRKKKKKKKQEDENGVPQVTAGGSNVPADSGVVKSHAPVPVPEAMIKQNVTPHISQKKADQNLEQPKPVQKKKARRET